MDGRRWRATDPAIPPPLRQELVDELMRARRAVGQLPDTDRERVAEARAQVHASKVALGERGPAWWEEPDEAADRQRLRAAIVALAGHRAPDRSICPSDAARAVGGERWRTLVPMAREEAADLARQGIVEVTQKGSALDPAGPWRGPVRIRWTPGGRASVALGRAAS